MARADMPCSLLLHVKQEQTACFHIRAAGKWKGLQGKRWLVLACENKVCSCSGLPKCSLAMLKLLWPVACL